ncbi:MAG TPA: aminomethyl-transferring glycine dehydrogenase subunit GcvPA [Gammaproteobacteria bacterium]
MPFIPHTTEDTEQMLRTIGIAAIDDLFDEIPAALRQIDLGAIPDAISEQELTRFMRRRAARDELDLCFLGAGAYEHHVPAAVWELATRGEYYTAYTPYQAEASQGTLQVIYEYQTMMASLTGEDVSNASLYDGASALAEAVLMAVRANRQSKSKTILLPEGLNPLYADTVRTITASQGISCLSLPYDSSSGRIDTAALEQHAAEDITALVIPQPNVFGALEDVDALADWALDHGVTGIAVVNPISLALLEPPGQWGRSGVPIACGEGQPLGIPLSSGGPYFGFLTCRKSHVRQLPGRLVGRTLDLDGRPGFTLTLQAREQHIRRSRATSNICTNQGLMVTAATIHMSLLGPEGLRRVALTCHQRAQALLKAATSIPGVEAVFPAPYFHEVVLRLPGDAGRVLARMAESGIAAGLPLEPWYPELENCVLACATETKTEDDIARYAESLEAALSPAGGMR